jgi:23S rRNA (cytidine1920-2'-O)/16S rRNA (cytidine1409-2'-O)-methyltransferase
MRADVYLTQAGHAASREKARRLIEAGAVLLDGRRLEKAAEPVDETQPHAVEITQREQYVSRGGLKLEGALDAFALDVQGCVALDVGASTGGFTDCLLQRGAAFVYAVDSGSDQLAPSLREDGRVCSMERCNARYLQKKDFERRCDLAVMDVSFISQTYLHGVLAGLLEEGASFVSLVKPQFEAGPSALNKKGLVTRPEDRRAALRRVLESARAAGFSCRGLIRSPIDGGDGNAEYLAHFVLDGGQAGAIWEPEIRALTEGGTSRK